jgi:hypothetical protein
LDQAARWSAADRDPLAEVLRRQGALRPRKERPPHLGVALLDEPRGVPARERFEPRGLKRIALRIALAILYGSL